MFRPKNKEERLQARESFLTGYVRQYVEEADCLIATQENEGRFLLLIFDGTAYKPTVNYWFKSDEQRQKYIERHLKERKDHIAAKEARKQAKNAAGKYAIDTSKPYFEVGQRYFMEYYGDDPYSHTAVIKVVKRTACFVSFVHFYGEREDSTVHRWKVHSVESGEVILDGHFYYFRAADRCLTDEEEAEQFRKEEEEQKAQNEARKAQELAEFEEIKRIIEGNPTTDADPYTVKVEWIEGLIEVADYMEDRTISVKAAEKIFSMVDANRVRLYSSSGGYDKWKFQILKHRDDTPVWVDRYDMGDDNGGFIAFMRLYTGRGAKFDEMVSTLEAMANGTCIISVTLAPWVEDFINTKKEDFKKEASEILEMVDFLTDQQLAAAVLENPFSGEKNTESNTVARFFLQRLAIRNQKKALEVFRAWYSGRGVEAIEDIF